MSHTFYFANQESLSEYLDNMMYHVRLIAKNEFIDDDIGTLFEQRDFLLSDNYYDFLLHIAATPVIRKYGEYSGVAEFLSNIDFHKGESLIRVTNNPNGYTVTEFDSVAVDLLIFSCNQ